MIYSISESSFRECDATIVTTSYSYESVSLDAIKEWFTSMQKGLHILGPLLPAGYGAETQKAEEGAGGDIEVFLEEKLKKHGKRSVFYVKSFPFSCRFRLISYYQVSFGTVHWPPVSEYIDELIDALIEKKAPFVRDMASVQKLAHYSIRFLLVRLPVVKYPSSRQRKSSRLVWEC